MRTKTLIITSAAVWMAGAYVYDEKIIGFVALFGHLLFWSFHRLEVKVNRLLDAKGIRVSETELSE